MHKAIGNNKSSLSRANWQNLTNNSKHYNSNWNLYKRNIQVWSLKMPVSKQV